MRAVLGSQGKKKVSPSWCWAQGEGEKGRLCLPPNLRTEGRSARRSVPRARQLHCCCCIALGMRD